MIHVDKNIYEELAEFIKGCEPGVWGWDSKDGRFTAEVRISGIYQEVYTGVEFLGEMESYMKFVLDSWDVTEFNAYNEDGEPEPCDFSVYSIVL